MTTFPPEVTATLKSLSRFADRENVWIAGSYATGKATAKSDLDILIGVTDEVFNEPMSFGLKAIEDDIWKTAPGADVFFYSLSDRNKIISIPAFTKPGGLAEKALVRNLWKEAKPIGEVVARGNPGFTPEITAQPPQGKLVQRSYHTPVGVVVDFGIQIGDTVYEPRASAVSPLGVSEAKKGWREVSEKDKENYRDWEKKPGAFGNRARKIADIEKRWNEIIAKGKTAQEHQVEQLASYESYMKRRAEAERQYSLKSSGLIVGMALEEIATGNRYVITEITDEGWVYARPEDEPTQSGGSIGKGEVKGYRLAVQKVLPTYETKAAPEVTKVMSVEEVSKLETRLPLKLLWKDEATYMDRLTTEIQEKGITEPVTIRVREDGSQIVWDGLHRLAVAQKLGIKDIPVQYIGEVGKLAIHKASSNPGFTAKEARSIGGKLGIDFKRYDVEQFRQGMSVELEHCNVTNCDPLLTGKIAQAHLSELPDYYTRLAKMEEASIMYNPDKIEAGHKGTKAPAEKGSLEQKANALLPMPPTDGPPLPRMFDLKWPWKK